MSQFFLKSSHFGLVFALLLPLKPKISKFWKNEKMPGDLIILDKCTKNYDQMMYGSWDTVRDRCNCYFSIWTIFCPFTPLTAQKLKILKKWKKHMETSSFNICVPKTMIRWCTVPEKWCVTDGQMDGRKDRWIEKATYRGGCPT